MSIVIPLTAHLWAECCHIGVARRESAERGGWKARGRHKDAFITRETATERGKAAKDSVAILRKLYVRAGTSFKICKSNFNIPFAVGKWIKSKGFMIMANEAVMTVHIPCVGREWPIPKYNYLRKCQWMGFRSE